MPGARDVRVLARSEPIPYPPLIVSRRLDADARARLKHAFTEVAHAKGVTPGMIRGYGGAVVDGYDARFPPQRFQPAAEKIAMVSDSLKGALLRRAAER
jgi:phosphonate transport system substrate-binding protein